MRGEPPHKHHNQSPMEETPKGTYTVLLVEDDPVDIRFVKDALLASPQCGFKVEIATMLSDGMERLSRGGIDLLLMDINLPDCTGAQTVEQVCLKASEIPVVVLTAEDDECLAVKSVQSGIQDYLVKGSLKIDPLGRILRQAIERHRLQQQLRALSHTDDLTGLLNRRGFWNLSEQQLKIANRRGSEVLVLFVDVDGMKYINDAFGHLQGDHTLKDVARLLKETFRESDIIARIGGDEFAVFAIDTPRQSARFLVKRLNDNIEALNRLQTSPVTLSVSVGVLVRKPSALTSLDDLLSLADSRMYMNKKVKNGESGVRN